MPITVENNKQTIDTVVEIPKESEIPRSIDIDDAESLMEYKIDAPKQVRRMMRQITKTNLDRALTQRDLEMRQNFQSITSILNSCCSIGRFWRLWMIKKQLQIAFKDDKDELDEDEQLYEFNIVELFARILDILLTGQFDKMSNWFNKYPRFVVKMIELFKKYFPREMRPYKINTKFLNTTDQKA